MSRRLSGLGWVVTVALIPVMLAGCGGHEDESAVWEREREEIELTQQLKLAEYRLGLGVAGDVAQLGTLKDTAREADRRLEGLQRTWTALNAEVREMAARNEELYQSIVRNQRAKSLGLKFVSFTAKDGRTFRNVSIVGVDDAGVAIRHEHGAATLRFADLSAEQCELFGLNENTALAAEEQERQDAVAYERGIDLEMEVVRGKEERAAAVAKSEADSRIARSLLASSSSARETRPLSKPATTFGSGSSYRRYGYSEYRSYRPTYRYVYYYPSTVNPYCSPRTYRSVVDNRVVYPRVP